MSLTNLFGDIVITEPQVMRALAHPVRIAALTRLQRHGPATATQLSPHVGATPSVVSWHLRHLARVGLVRDADESEISGDRRQRWWQAVARGFSVAMGDDPESQAAGRMLVGEMFATTQAQTSRWLTDTEPILEPIWRRLAGLAATRITVSPGELDELAGKFDELLAEFVHRKEGDAPADARPVRVIRSYLPEAAERTT